MAQRLLSVEASVSLGDMVAASLTTEIQVGPWQDSSQSELQREAGWQPTRLAEKTHSELRTHFGAESPLKAIVPEETEDRA